MFQMAETLKSQEARTDFHYVADHTCMPFLGKCVG
jgi:hypothetical protein